MQKNKLQEHIKKVFPYILLGVGIGAIIHNWIPKTWIEGILGSINHLIFSLPSSESYVC